MTDDCRTNRRDDGGPKAGRTVWPPLIRVATGLHLGQLFWSQTTVPFLLLAVATIVLTRCGTRLRESLIVWLAAALGAAQMTNLLDAPIPANDISRWAGHEVQLRGRVSGRPLDGRSSRIRLVLDVSVARDRDQSWRA